MHDCTTHTTWPAVPIQVSDNPIDERTVVRHAGLRVADLDRTQHFYVDLLGFNLMLRNPVLMLLSASGYHHDLSFWCRESRGGSPAPVEATGLDHIAIAYPTLEALGDALRRLHEAGWPIEHATNFSGHIGVHVLDPDGNMLEFQWDKPTDEWELDENGHLPNAVKVIDVADLGFGLSSADLGATTLPAPRSIT